MIDDNDDDDDERPVSYLLALSHLRCRPMPSWSPAAVEGGRRRWKKKIFITKGKRFIEQVHH